MEKVEAKNGGGIGRWISPLRGVGAKIYAFNAIRRLRQSGRPVVAPTQGQRGIAAPTQGQSRIAARLRKDRVGLLRLRKDREGLLRLRKERVGLLCAYARTE